MSTQYTFEAVDQRGATHRGKVAARSESEVESHLAEQQLLPIRIRPARSRLLSNDIGLSSASRLEQLILFTNSLATLHRAGVPLLRALSIIRIGKSNGRANRTIDGLRQSLEEGRSLSEAMEDHDWLFSRVYTASVAAGEESGQLDRTLDELSAMLEREAELVRQIKGATRYPLIVISVIALAVLVMMTVVVPRFVDFYASFNAQLPLPTRVLISVSDFVTGYWYLGVGLAAAAALAFRRLLSSEAGRLRFDRILLGIPVVGDLVVKGNIARFSFMFRILYQAGIPLVRSLDILAGTVKNTQLAAEVRRLSELFRKGRDIHALKQDFRYFPDLSLHLMGIGMESGSLDDVMHQVGHHYSRETLYRSRRLTAILEPLLTLVLGGFVLVLALAIFLPMWSLIKLFQG
jgi:type II secretory pathway component PulF